MRNFDRVCITIYSYDLQLRLHIAGLYKNDHERKSQERKVSYRLFDSQFDTSANGQTSYATRALKYFARKPS